VIERADLIEKLKKLHLLTGSTLTEIQAQALYDELKGLDRVTLLKAFREVSRDFRGRPTMNKIMEKYHEVDAKEREIRITREKLKRQREEEDLWRSNSENSEELKKLINQFVKTLEE
jgi:hypothetical protein